MTLVRGGFETPEATTEFEDLRRQLLEMPDLKLVVFDPLQAFVGADVNKDPAAGQFLCTTLGQLAAATGATVVVTHHFRKPSSAKSQIKSPAEARDAVRGSTALIDGMRCVLAFWPSVEPYAKKVCAQLGDKFERNKIIMVAVVKANWPTDQTVRTYTRDAVGLLRSYGDRIGNLDEDREALLQQLEEAIGMAALKGMPYTKSGKIRCVRPS